MRLLFVVLIVGLRTATTAWALDRPIDATKITLKRSSSGKEGLTFVTKDPGKPFPAIGSLDDPASGLPRASTGDTRTCEASRRASSCRRATTSSTECQYDNGVTRPVRTDGAGNPTNLIFGVSAEDAMCIITGAYYE